MFHDERLLDLLDRWQEFRGRGLAVSVDELCVDCPELRQDVEQAIRELETADAFFSPVLGGGATLPLSVSPGGMNGLPIVDGARFQVLRPHRQGGLGEVFIAYDEELEREVALKRIQTMHAAHAESCRRFLREAKITGRLEHPGIVPVYGLMSKGKGPPCYAMRMIEGETLKEAIEAFHRGVGERMLALRQLLSRFLTVCHTIAYAHSRGIIHRDLKPANVILGKFGETIVVDWGLAKPIDHAEGAPKRGQGSFPASEPSVEESANARKNPVPFSGPEQDSVATEQGQVVGTPQYMSPEQAAGRADQVGPASDIYSLGATLYCLLTGSVPFPDPRETSVQAVLEQVRHGQFRRPRQVQRRIPRPLEAICLKAMALRCEDRYASAQALADDLEHWLADEPVTAYREPRPTRAARWLRRHKTLGVSGAVLAGTALLALLISTAFLTRAKVRAETAEANAAAINRFLTEDLLAAVRPGALGPNVAMRQVLDAAAAKLDGAFPGQPRVEASVRRTIGRTYYLLGLTSEAEPHLRRAVDLSRECFGGEHLETLNAMNDLASVLLGQGRLAEAEPLFRQNLATSRRLLGSDHGDTLNAVNNLALLLEKQRQFAEAESLLWQTLQDRRRISGPDHPETLNVANNLGCFIMHRGRLAEAEAILRRNLEDRRRVSGPHHADTVVSMHNLGDVLRRQGKWSEAEPLLWQNLEDRRIVYGRDHPDTFKAVNLLASVLCAQGKHVEAEPLARQNLEDCRRSFGRDNFNTIEALDNLSRVLHKQGKRVESEALLREILEACLQVYGPDHFQTVPGIFNLAAMLCEELKFAEAEPLARQCVDGCRRLWGPDDPNTLNAVENLAQALLGQGKFSEAESLYRHYLEGHCRRSNSDRTKHPGPVMKLAGVLWHRDNLAEAEMLLREVFDRRDALSAPTELALSLSLLGGLLNEKGETQEAEPLLREALGLRKVLPANHVALLSSLNGLGSLLTDTGRAREAEPLLQEALEMASATRTAGHQTIALTKGLLGGCLVALGRCAEAEPLLLSSYEVLKSAPWVRPLWSREATERVTHLYEAWNKPEKAAEWRRLK